MDKRLAVVLLSALAYLAAVPAYYHHVSQFSSVHESLGVHRCCDPNCACRDVQGRLDRFHKPGHDPAHCLICVTAATMAAEVVVLAPAERGPVGSSCEHAAPAAPHSRAPLRVSCRSPPA